MTTPPTAARAEGLLVLLHEIERHCPCGARPESPTTHPHSGGCPVYEAIQLAATLQAALARVTDTGVRDWRRAETAEAENVELRRDRVELARVTEERDKAVRSGKYGSLESNRMAQQERAEKAEAENAALRSALEMVTRIARDTLAGRAAS